MLNRFSRMIAGGVAMLVLSSTAMAQTTDPRIMAEGGNAATGFDMAPETRVEVVESAVGAIPVKLPDGPFKPTWDSLKANYKVPQWFAEAKFGIFMHWGLYAVPAYHNEWYMKHMYGNSGIRQWHTQNFGPIEQFGYKDFIPKFTAEKYDPQAWGELFKQAGAKFVIPTAQHHDGFALWDSEHTPFNAMDMGPKRDLIGEMARAVRERGMKFGVSNHGIENFQFIEQQAIPAALLNTLKEKKLDLFDPTFAEFYNVADRSDEACRKFLVNWAMRNVELIEKYQVDMLWFDNGVDMRFLDPIKLWMASYYYNRAIQMGKEVSISTKKAAYAPTDKNTEQIGSIVDFEKVGARSPTGIRPGVWQVDDNLGSTWGYTSNMTVAGTQAILGRLVDTVAKNGTYLLNISPKPDGTIPDEQQKVLREIGQWLSVNGEAIYGTHNWSRFNDAPGGLNVRFTVRDQALYAIILGNWPGSEAVIRSLGTGQGLEGKITSITLLGAAGELSFSQDESGLKVQLPQAAPGRFAHTLKISGLKMNPSTVTVSGNP